MIYLKQNDHGVGRKATLTNNKGAVNLTDSEVVFVFNGHEINTTIEDAENGEVLVVFNKIHTKDPGLFSGEFKIIRLGSRETIPVENYIKVHIWEEVN